MIGSMGSWLLSRSAGTLFRRRTSSPGVTVAYAAAGQVAFARPTAQQLLDQLTSAARRTGRVSDAPTQVISSQIWQTGLYSRPPRAGQTRQAALFPANPHQRPRAANR